MNDLNDFAGEQFMLELLKAQIPRNYETFVAGIYFHLDRAIGFMESDACDFMHAHEDTITRDLVRSLRMIGYHASHDRHSGGHCDITVLSLDQQLSWLGEAKRWKGSAYVAGGLNQLLKRYSQGTPGNTAGGILIYIQEAASASRVLQWKEYLGAIGFVPGGEEKNRPQFNFFTQHVHERVGEHGSPYTIRHMGISLFRPASENKRRN